MSVQRPELWQNVSRFRGWCLITRVEILEDGAARVGHKYLSLDHIIRICVETRCLPLPPAVPSLQHLF